MLNAAVGGGGPAVMMSKERVETYPPGQIWGSSQGSLQMQGIAPGGHEGLTARLS